MPALIRSKEYEGIAQPLKGELFMKLQTAKPKTAKDFLESLGLILDERTRRGIRLEIKNDDPFIDGFLFPSDAEKRRYVELKIKSATGEIQNLIVASAAGVSYKLDGAESYQPTFLYFNRFGELVLEDARKFQSAENLQKIEMMKTDHNLVVKIISS
jgi:hypothetical protein